MPVVIGGLGATRTTPVTVHREGRGRLYYRVGVEWAEGDPPARAQGLEVATALRGVDDVVDHRLQAGERYALDVTISTDAAQHHVAVEVPLPAGLEAIDRRLGSGVSTSVPRLPARWAPSLTHYELHPDRIQLFFDELPPGTQSTTIYVLAATAGEYTMPAATAEAMYEPEIRARATSQRVVVEP